jgi:hypothetical protein
MLDNSASIKNNLPAIKEAAIDFVKSKDKNQRIAIYSFSEQVILLQDFSDSTNILVKAIDGLRQGPMSTDLYGAVITGTGRWKEEYNEKQVIDGFLLLLTDGADTQGRYTLGQALDACKDKKVLAVGVGNELDTKILSNIANCGFSKINDYSELPKKFKEFQDFMVDWANSFYWLVYKSPKRGNHYHTFKMLLWPEGSRKPIDSLSVHYNSANFISGF